MYSGDATLKFQQPLLQSSVSHDQTFLIIINVKINKFQIFAFLCKPDICFMILWWVESSEEKLLFEMKICWLS